MEFVAERTHFSQDSRSSVIQKTNKKTLQLQELNRRLSCSNCTEAAADLQGATRRRSVSVVLLLLLLLRGAALVQTELNCRGLASFIP